MIYQIEIANHIDLLTEHLPEYAMLLKHSGGTQYEISEDDVVDLLDELYSATVYLGQDEKNNPTPLGYKLEDLHDSILYQVLEIDKHRED